MPNQKLSEEMYLYERIVGRFFFERLAQRSVVLVHYRPSFHLLCVFSAIFLHRIYSS